MNALNGSENELQKKSEIIIEQNEKNAALSDTVQEYRRQLEENQEELRELRWNYQEIADKAAADEVADEKSRKAKSFLDQANEILAESRRNETRISRREERIDAEIAEKADRRFKEFKARYIGITALALLYGLLITVFTAYKTELVTNDTAAFFEAFRQSLVKGTIPLSRAGEKVALLGDLIPQPQMAWATHWILRVIITLGLIGIIVSLAVMMLRHYIAYFRKRQADAISVFAILVDLAVMVFLTDCVKKAAPLNLVFLALLAFLIYSGCRAFAQIESDRIKNNVLLTVAAILAVWAGFEGALRYPLITAFTVIVLTLASIAVMWVGMAVNRRREKRRNI